MSDNMLLKEALFEQLLQQESIDLEPAPVVNRRDDRVEAPLSFAQSRLWFLDHLDGPTPNYNMPGLLRLTGELDVEDLRLSLREIRNRHDSLRTRFVMRGDEAVQVIDPPSDFALPIVDLTDLNADDREARFQRLESENALQPFDLQNGPLLRAQLVRLDPRSHVLLFAMHHIICDGWSVGVLIGELMALYRALHTGVTLELPELTIQFADYAAWQRADRTRESLASSLSYWRDRLAGAPELLSLPTDRSRPPVQSYGGRLHRFQFGADLTARLLGLSRQCDCTLFMVLQAGFAALLSRYNGSDDIVFGTPVANRTVAGIEPLIGFFVNTLVLRTDLSGDPTFAELIARVRRASLDDLDHQDLPFELLVEELQPQRNLSHTPLIQALLILQNTPRNELELPGLTVSVEEPESHISKFDVTVSLTETNAGLAGEVEYNTDLFDAATIKRMVGHLENMLDAMTREPGTRVSEAEFLGAEELQRLLHTWNATAAPLPEECIHTLFEAQATKTPHAPAVLFEDQTLSYAELNTRANQLAHTLIELGVKPDTLVAVALERSPQMIVALMATLKAGGAYVPLDPEYPAERLAFMLEDSGAEILITEESVKPRLQHRAEHTLCLDWDWTSFAHKPDSNPGRPVAPHQLAYVIYTSGSTGKPKGAMNTHRAILNRLLWMQAAFPLDGSDRVLQKTPSSFDVSVWEFFWPLMTGARLVFARPGGHRDNDYLCELICREQITTMHFVPPMLRVFLDTPDARQCHSLRRVICSGQELPVNSVSRFFEVLPDCELHNLYGPTEAAIDVTWFPCSPQTAQLDSVPIGRPITNTQVYVLDGHGQPTPTGVAGELHLGGTNLARGYLNRPELTAEKFIPDPFSREPCGRLYRTGDLVRYRADGNLEFLGRLDHQVKVRGFRIELGEIEAALAAHPGVHETVVIARAQDSGDHRLVAYIVAAETAPAAGELRGFLQQTLPDYMLPAAFVFLPALPLTPNGKVDRKALPEPELATPTHAVAPRTALEEVLVGLWASALHLNMVGIHNNFFELGGHSLLAIQLTSRLREALGIDVPVRWLFEAPTVAELAGRIQTAEQNGEAAVPIPANRILAGTSRITPDMLPLAKLTQSEIDQVVSRVEGGTKNVQDIYALAPLQAGILFHHRLQDSGDAYLSYALLAIDSPARREAIVGALQAVVDRHDILRTAVVWEQLPEPLQVVWRNAPLPVETLHFDSAAGPIAEQLVEHCHPRHTRLDVTRAPLLRVFLAPDGERTLLLLLFHHLIDDNTTLKVLHEETAMLLRGEADQLPAPVPFRNFVAAARGGVTPAEDEAFFGEMLGDIDAPTAPFGLLDVQGDGAEIVEGRRDLPPELALRLRTQAGRLGATPAALCHLAWGLVLARCCGQDDVVFGTVLFGRLQGGEGVERALGIFINTLPLRISCDGRPVAEALRDTQRSLLALLRHEHASLSLAQRCSALAAPTPLFSSLLNYRHGQTDDEEPQLEGIEILQLEERTNYPFALAVDDLGEGFGLTAQVDPAVDPDRICGLMQRALEALVTALEETPQTPLCALDILPAAERHQLLVDWNATAAPLPPECVHERFEAQASRTPEAPAVVFEDEVLSYAELNARANQLAHALIESGVETDTLVAIALERSPQMIVALLATLKAGGAYVPLDPEYPAERLAYMLEDSGARILLTQESLRSRLPQGAEQVLCLDTDWTSLARQPDSNPQRAVAPHHLAYVIYTSGSTGRPKGVMIPHRALANHMDWMQQAFEVAPDDRVLQKTPFSFDASVWEFYLPLVTGGTLIVARPQGHNDTEYLVEAIRRHRVTIFQGVPTLLRMLADAEGFAELDSLRYIFSGGEALTADLRDKLLDTSNAALCNLYGPTEACIDATFHVCPRGAENGADAPAVPIGRPIQNATAYVLDESRQPVPVGAAGELYLGGVPLARGYWDRTELTAERFVQNPFGEGSLYRTGDRVRYRADGNLEFLGRTDDQIKLRGFRIELGEIEAALRAHAMVQDAAVVCADRAGDRRLCAFVAAAPDGIVAMAELRSWLAGRVPEYMVPANWALVESLPRLPNGKINRAALPVEQAVHEARPNATAPLTGSEQLLASMWAEILDADHVGRHDNFFELGGHSLLATQLVSRVRGAFAVELPLRRIFEAPTVAELAQVVEEEVRAQKNLKPLPKIEPAPRDAEAPLSFAQERLWFLHQLEEDNPFYNMPMALELDGKLDVDALQRALDELVRRHESLRTSFKRTDGKPAQVIAANWELALGTADLTDLAPDQQPDEVRRRAEQEALSTFDLSQDLLLRAKLLRLGDDRHVLLLTLHHITADGWSLGIFVEELTKLYAAFAGGQPSPLAELPIQYADFAVWQREHLQNQVLDTQMSYWKRQLGGAPPVLNLPADHGRPPVHTYRGGQANFRIDKELSDRLRALSRESGCTLFMTLLSGFSVLLSRYAGQDDIVVGTPIANRHRKEIEPLIGFFVNTLAIRTDLSDDPNFGDLLARVRRTTLDAYTHQDLPFERLVEELQPERDTSRNPLVQVSLAMQNAPMPPVEVEGLTLTSLDYEAQTVRFDMEFHLWDHDDGIEGYLLYYNDIFEADTAARLLRHFENLLRSAVEQPDRPVSALALLDEQDLGLLLDWSSDRDAEPPPNECLHRFFEVQVDRTPDAVAAEFAGQRLTYRQLNQRANQVAWRLREEGVEAEDLVGICVERSLEMLVGILGILKAGGAYVPLDPAYPSDRLAFMLEDTGAPVLLTQQGLCEGLPPHSATVIKLDSDWPQIAQRSDSNPSPQTTAENLAYVIYTSGSTGLPKGVAIEHRNAAALVAWAQSSFDRATFEHVLASTSMCFDLSVFEMFVTWSVGGNVVVVPNILTLAESPDIPDITLINTVPSAMRELLAVGGIPASVRTVNLAGEPLLPSLVDDIYQKTAVRQVYDLYGPSEDTTYSTFALRTPGGRETIGRPIDNTQAFVLDGMKPVPVGVVGELYLGGAGLARGYLNRPELTAERFVPNPFAEDPHARLYKTGDLCRWLPDGNLEFLGRIDHQVKIRGFRIELGEIETAIRKQPGVENAVAIVREDRPGDRRIVAYLRSDPAYEPPSAGDSAEDGGHLAELISQWQNVFDDSYGQAGSQSQLDFFITGWNSSYDGQPIPAEQMHEWVDTTVDRILALHPREMLEIGCGTGLLLSRVAPHCTRYIGNDISNVAVQHIGRLKQHMPGLAGVQAQQRAADDFSDVEPGSLDVVVLNSVAQYFPDLKYFMRVFEGALAALRDGGSLFLGDLRNLRLLEMYHASIQLFQAADDMSASQLRERIEAQTAQEGELLLDPALFELLRQQYPRISDVRVLLKRGRYRNEMTAFRYDVVVTVADESPAAAAPQWTDWQQTQPAVADVQRVLQDDQPAVLAYAGVANARLERDLRTLEWLAVADGDEAIGPWRSKLEESSRAVDPEALLALGAALGYEVEVSWANADPKGRFDVVFYRGPRPRLAGRFQDPSDLQIEDCANNPLRRKRSLELIPAVRQALQTQLPAYMVPAAFVLVDDFPRTASGKLDRRALPAPDATGRSLEKQFVAPRTETETILADVWAQVLGLEQVGVQDNFFELGGDSILSIQIVSRASRAGVSISPRQIFQNQTIEELAGAAGESFAAVESEIAVGQVPLTPIQHWFFETEQPQPQHYNQALLLETSPRLNAEQLKRAFFVLLKHHSSLHLRFARDGDRWRQFYADDERSAEFTTVDWSSQSPAQRLATLESTAQRLQTGLDLTDGPLVQAAYFHGAADEPGRLLWIVHHLLIDGVSWRILLEDLETACQQMERDEPILLAPASASFKSWALGLQEYARSAELQAELDFWQSASAATVRSLPADGLAVSQDNIHGNASSLSFHLSAESTKALLHEVPTVYRTGINDILLTALVETFGDWTGDRSLRLDLEGHGREDLFPGLDFGRTIGWFTTIFPVQLGLNDCHVPGEAIKSIKEQLRQIPRHGIGYGLLRYLAGDASAGQSFSEAPQPEVAFNYLGQLDVSFDKSRYFRPASDPSGSSISPQHRRRHQLEINASIISDALLVEWTFVAARFRPETIERLGQTYLDRLQALIDHCRSPEAGGFTPSDFAAARVDQKNLDRLLSKLKKSS